MTCGFVVSTRKFEWRAGLQTIAVERQEDLRPWREGKGRSHRYPMLPHRCPTTIPCCPTTIPCYPTVIPPLSHAIPSLSHAAHSPPSLPICHHPLVCRCLLDIAAPPKYGKPHPNMATCDSSPPSLSASSLSGRALRWWRAYVRNSCSSCNVVRELSFRMVSSACGGGR